MQSLRSAKEVRPGWNSTVYDTPAGCFLRTPTVRRGPSRPAAITPAAPPAGGAVIGKGSPMTRIRTAHCFETAAVLLVAAAAVLSAGQAAPARPPRLEVSHSARALETRRSGPADVQGLGGVNLLGARHGVRAAVHGLPGDLARHVARAGRHRPRAEARTRRGRCRRATGRRLGPFRKPATDGGGEDVRHASTEGGAGVCHASAGRAVADRTRAPAPGPHPVGHFAPVAVGRRLRPACRRRGDLGVWRAERLQW